MPASLHAGAVRACASRRASLRLEKAADHSPRFPGVLGSLGPHGTERGDMSGDLSLRCRSDRHRPRALSRVFELDCNEKKTESQRDVSCGGA